MTGRARRQQRKRARRLADREWLALIMGDVHFGGRPIAVPNLVGPPPYGHISADARRALEEFAEEFLQSLGIEPWRHRLFEHLVFPKRGELFPPRVTRHF